MAHTQVGTQQAKTKIRQSERERLFLSGHRDDSIQHFDGVLPAPFA